MLQDDHLESHTSHHSQVRPPHPHWVTCWAPPSQRSLDYPGVHTQAGTSSHKSSTEQTHPASPLSEMRPQATPAPPSITHMCTHTGSIVCLQLTNSPASVTVPLPPSEHPLLAGCPRAAPDLALGPTSPSPPQRLPACRVPKGRRLRRTRSLRLLHPHLPPTWAPPAAGRWRGKRGREVFPPSFHQDIFILGALTKTRGEAIA